MKILVCIKQVPDTTDINREALEKAHRTDLIGFDKKCLIRPRRGEQVKKEEVKPSKKKTIRNVHKKKKK